MSLNDIILNFLLEFFSCQVSRIFSREQSTKKKELNASDRKKEKRVPKEKNAIENNLKLHSLNQLQANSQSP